MNGAGFSEPKGGAFFARVVSPHLVWKRDIRYGRGAPQSACNFLGLRAVILGVKRDIRLGATARNFFYTCLKNDAPAAVCARLMDWSKGRGWGRLSSRRPRVLSRVRRRRYGFLDARFFVEAYFVFPYDASRNKRFFVFFMQKPFVSLAFALAMVAPLAMVAAAPENAKLTPLSYGRDGAKTVDLGVGLWATPIPYDVNADGFPDLFVVSCGSPATKDVYYFENTGRLDSETGAPLFKKGAPLDAAQWKNGVRVSHAGVDVTPSYVRENGAQRLRVVSPKGEFPDFLKSGLAHPVALPFSRRDVYNPSGNHRGQTWSYVDWNGDGVLDWLIGLGDWTDYGWDAAYDENGRWRNGPLHGFVFVALNKGTNAKPVYEKAFQVFADKRAIDVYGNPSPNFADFRGDGVKDLICGEFVDGFTLIQNVGTPQAPEFLAGKPLRDENGDYLKMHLEMIEPVAYDWDGDGRADLVVGQEDGRVALIRNRGIAAPQTPATPPRGAKARCSARPWMWRRICAFRLSPGISTTSVSACTATAMWSTAAARRCIIRSSGRSTLG